MRSNEEGSPSEPNPAFVPGFSAVPPPANFDPTQSIVVAATRPDTWGTFERHSRSVVLAGGDLPAAIPAARGRGYSVGYNSKLRVAQRLLGIVGGVQEASGREDRFAIISIWDPTNPSIPESFVLASLNPTLGQRSINPILIPSESEAPLIIGRPPGGNDQGSLGAANASASLRLFFSAHVDTRTNEIIIGDEYSPHGTRVIAPDPASDMQHPESHGGLARWPVRSAEAARFVRRQAATMGDLDDTLTDILPGDLQG